MESDSDSTSGSIGGGDSDDDDENGVIFQALHSSLVVDKSVEEETTYGRLLTSSFYLWWDARAHSQSCSK